MMDNWDEYEGAAAPKFGGVWDEEPADTIPESWETVSEPKPAPVEKPTVRSKQPNAVKTKEKEGGRRREKEERKKRQDEEAQSGVENLTELQRQRLAEEAEWGLLQDTLGGQPTAVSNVIDSFEPITKEDFNKFNQMLRDKFAKFEKSPHFPAFIEQLLRDTIAEMDIESLRSVSTTVTTMISEKQKLLKQSKTKKKGKGKLVVERGIDDFGDEDGAVLQEDDFEDFI